MAEKRVTDAQTDLRASQDQLDRLEAQDKLRKREFNETQVALLRLAREEKTVVSVSEFHSNMIAVSLTYVN